MTLTVLLDATLERIFSIFPLLSPIPRELIQHSDFRQLSCRVFHDHTGIANAYDTFTGVTTDGQVRIVHGRTTLVFVKRGSQWKIVSAHFSHLPHAS